MQIRNTSILILIYHCLPLIPACLDRRERERLVQLACLKMKERNKATLERRISTAKEGAAEARPATNDHSNTDSGGYHWGYEGGDLGDSWRGEEEDEDEPAENGGVEEMVDGFLYGEENRQFRSKVWTEFSKVRVGGIVTKGQCIHCNVEISAKRGPGTSAMGNHLKRCKVRQSVMNIENQLKSTVMSPEGVALKEWRFSQDVSRRELDRMISLHGMQFSVVEYDGFRRFVSSLNPAFKMTSRRTITADTMKAFKEQKQALQEALRTANSRVSLTMDMWTSNQTLGYMCITCHFLDAD